MSSPTQRSKALLESQGYKVWIVEDRMHEIWKPVVGYEGLYEVSCFGNIRSIDRIDSAGMRRAGKMMHQCNDLDGYLLTGFCMNGKTRSMRVHRIVAEAFISNPDALPHVNHIDGDKKNNRVENLEWVTHRQNKEHAKNHGLTARGTGSGRSTLSEKDVDAIRKMTQEGFGPKAISKMLGIGISAINHVRQGRCWGWYGKSNATQ